MVEYKKLLVVWLTTFTSWALNANFHSLLVDLSLVVAILASLSTFSIQVIKIFKYIKNENQNED